MIATIFRTKNVPEEWTRDYTPNARDFGLHSKVNGRLELSATKAELIPNQCVNESKRQCIQENERLDWTNSM